MELRIKANPNPEKFAEVSAAIQAEDGYCCCKLQHIPENKCVCREFYNQDTPGFCSCGKYYKTPVLPIITLCGSTRFKEEFLQKQKELTLKGYIVLSVGLFGHSGDEEVWDEGNKQLLDDLHKAKIEMSSAIYVINKNGYIGESTKSEIEWAQQLGKKIYYLEEKKDR